MVEDYLKFLEEAGLNLDVNFKLFSGTDHNAFAESLDEEFLPLFKDNDTLHGTSLQIT